jgi:ATP-dependent RNA helicase SUPV3L1/SUV3
MSRFAASRTTAVLGPTNTGKTFLAIERMLGHESGVVGFPLRLLARENYERIAKAKGRSRVALVTGEEKIIPPRARYFCCTVESMPLERAFAFLAVDEIQLAADPERGHVFTDRLLHARGDEETMFLGSETVRPVLGALVPEAEHISRPRFSKLSYSGEQHLNRLPPRSAVIAFSAAEVYATAELVRRRRGGTAVVLGALSPRTRNAQVAMFEAGEVDYLVATDAIGMGLNLKLDHVAFSDLGKFDGRRRRPLSAPEVAQIAGRAGRHLSDGTFGTTLQAGPLREEIVEAVEAHRFDRLSALYWRNRDLDFKDVETLLASLDLRPHAPQLMRVRDAEDHLALKRLAGDPAVSGRAGDPGRVRLLWEVCQIPDFEKEMSDRHLRLLNRVFGLLCEGDGWLPDDWIDRRLARIDRTDGDIDHLAQRIGQIRTWTYISHRADWLADSDHWQERTRDIEDRLSDALHERLTQRFVDRRTTMLIQRLRERGHLLGACRADGEVLVEGERVGQLDGFRLELDKSMDKELTRPLMAAARRAVMDEISRRLQRLEDDGDEAFALHSDQLFWHGHPLARLKGGDDLLAPRIVPLAAGELDGGDRERLRRRLADWLERYLRRRLAPLFALRDAPLQGSARGLAFQVAESLGTLPRAAARQQLAALGRAERRTLAALGLRIGQIGCHMPTLVDDGGARLRALLWSLRAKAEVELDALPRGPVLAPDGQLDEGLLLALGYLWIGAPGSGRLAVRADLLERLAAGARRRARKGPFVPDRALRDVLEVDAETLGVLLRGLGYRNEPGEDGRPLFVPASRRSSSAQRQSRRRRRSKGRRDDDSPFAVLAGLKSAKKSR